MNTAPELPQALQEHHVETPINQIHQQIETHIAQAQGENVSTGSTRADHNEILPQVNTAHLEAEVAQTEVESDKPVIMEEKNPSVWQRITGLFRKPSDGNLDSSVAQKVQEEYLSEAQKQLEERKN